MLAVVKQRLALTTEEGTHVLVPSPHPQLIPDRLEQHPYLRSCVSSGHVQILESPKPVAAVPEVPPPASKPATKGRAAKAAKG